MGGAPRPTLLRAPSFFPQICSPPVMSHPSHLRRPGAPSSLNRGLQLEGDSDGGDSDDAGPGCPGNAPARVPASAGRSARSPDPTPPPPPHSVFLPPPPPHHTSSPGIIGPAHAPSTAHPPPAPPRPLSCEAAVAWRPLDGGVPRRCPAAERGDF